MNANTNDKKCLLDEKELNNRHIDRGSMTLIEQINKIL